MSSLRLALKLSLQENPEAASTEKQSDPFDSLNAIVGRKRKGSLDKKEPRKKPRDESSSSSKHKNRSGDDQNRDGSSVAGDSYTSIGLNADEASVSSHALHKDDDTHDDNDEGDDDATAASLSAVTTYVLQTQQNISDAEYLKIKEETVSVTSVKSEKNTDKIESASDSTITANENAFDTQFGSISEDKQDEVTSPRKTGGKKKRLLKGLDVSEKDVTDALMEGDDDGPRYQSHRAAAMVAKTKLNVTTTTSTGKQEVAETAVSTINTTSTVTKEPSRRGGWNRGTGRAAAVRALQQQQQQLEQEQVPIEWVLCDKCGKWRSLSPTIEIQSLPEVWQCSDNTWDLQHNHCEAPEQSEEEAKRMYSIGDGMKSMPPSLDPPRVKREGSDATSGGGSVSLGMAETPMRGIGDEADNETGGGPMTSGRGGRAGGTRGRGGRGGRRGSGAAGIMSTGNAAGSDDSDDDDAGAGNNGVSGRSSRRQVNYAEDDEDAGGGGGRASGQRRRGGFPSRNSGRDLNASFAAMAAPAAAVNWVQCNKCKKWRKVPETIDVSKLPETWLCHMNTWNPLVARCTAREEVDEPVGDGSLMTGAGGGTTPGRSSGRAGGGSGVGRYGSGASAANNQQVQAVIAAMIAANAAAIAAAANAPPLPPGVIRQIKWVQCERKNCKKWRKVPAYIDMETFPEKWYCEMNFWSPERASCEVAEDHDSDEERKKKEARNNRNLLLGNNKGGAQLSYRRIIYGTDAKVRPHFAEKIKLGNGIFTYSLASRKMNDDDDDENVFHYNEGLEPVRRVPYWWSTSHDDRLHGLHPNCVPATFVPTTGVAGAVADVATDTLKESTSTTDFLTLSSSSAANNAYKTNDPKASLSYLMDTARRLYQEATNTTPLGWTAHGNDDIRAVESMKQINSLTLYQRMTVEMNVVRTLLHSSNDVHVLFIRLMDLMATCQFLNPVFEACRYLLVDQKSALVDIVHRLEEKGEIEVGYTRDNQLVITLLPSLDTLKQELASRRTVFDHKINASAKERHFNPRLRKCFQQSNASALSTHEITVDTLPYSESTFRAVATAVNLPVRTNDDGSLLLQFPDSGPNKIVHSSETLAPTDAPVIPPLTSEELTMIAAAANAAGGMHGSGNVASNNNNNNSNGNSKVFIPSSNNTPSTQYQLQQQQLQQQQLMGVSAMGGRGKRGGGGGGRGRGRGRGGGVAIGSDGGMERPMGGRGAAKRAAKAAADAAAAALGAGLPTSEHLLASSVGAIVQMDGADPVKRARKPYTKRKTPSLDEPNVLADTSFTTVSAVIPTATVMNRDTGTAANMDTGVSSTSEAGKASVSTNSISTTDVASASVPKKDFESAVKMEEDEEVEDEEDGEDEESELDSEEGSEEDGEEEADEDDDEEDNVEAAFVDKDNHEKKDKMEENVDEDEKQVPSECDEEEEESCSAGEDDEKETSEDKEIVNKDIVNADTDDDQDGEPGDETQDMTMHDMPQSFHKVKDKTDILTNENTAVNEEEGNGDDIDSLEDHANSVAMDTAAEVVLDTASSVIRNSSLENVSHGNQNSDAIDVCEAPTSSAMDVDE